MKPVDDPGVVLLKFEKSEPGSVGFQGERFFVRLKIDKPASPRKIRKSAPLSGYQGGMIAVLSGTDNPGMLIQGEGNLGLQCKPGSFENDFRAELGGHRGLVFQTDLVRHV
jgi:hypothetical protein